MKKITARWLHSKGACSPKIKRFKEIFGESAKVNYENAALWRKKVHSWRHDFLWLFWESFAYEYTLERIEILRQLTDYMKIQTNGAAFDMCFSSKEKLTTLKPQRFVWAITQIMYRA